MLIFITFFACDGRATILSLLDYTLVVNNVLFDELQHSLIAFQLEHVNTLQRLNIPYFPPASLLQGPAECYVRFLQLVTQALGFVDCWCLIGCCFF